MPNEILEKRRTSRHRLLQLSVSRRFGQVYYMQTMSVPCLANPYNILADKVLRTGRIYQNAYACEQHINLYRD